MKAPYHHEANTTLTRSKSYTNLEINSRERFSIKQLRSKTTQLLSSVNTASICTVMQSLTSGVSRLSISEPSTTSAPPRIPKEYDLGDSEHEALDGDVRSNFEVLIELGREPKWPALLSYIVNADSRLKTMSIKEAEELLGRHSFLMPILQKGWTSHSFAEVRRLRMLHFSIPSDHHR